jgi:hypothetical protein
MTTDSMAVCSRKCGVPWCRSDAYPGSEWCQFHEVVNPFDDDPKPEVCKYCGKELGDVSDLGCAVCDARHPLFGVMP